MIQDHLGRWWGTRAQVAEAVGVSPDLVSNWARARVGLVHPRDGWYLLAEVIEAEHATRVSRLGRPRTCDTHAQDPA